MRLFGTAVAALAVCLTGSVGCHRPASAHGAASLAAAIPTPVPVPEKWVSEILADITRWIAEGTGIDFTPGGLMISNAGVWKGAAGSAHISYFQITVTFRGTEFASAMRDIPCTADGFPTEEGNRLIKEDVEKISARIRAAR